MPGASKEALVHTAVTKTDSNGRWSVPGGATLRFALPVPEMPVVADELTVQAAGVAAFHTPLDHPLDGETEATREASPLRVTWNDPPPSSVLMLPVFGIAAGAGQKASVHVGEMIVAGRKVGAGLRGELGAGINAASAALGILIPFRPTMPVLGVEVSGRYMRPWSSGDGHRSEWGAEIGLDIDCWRLTVTALGPSSLTPVSQRRAVVGFGWGYF